MELARNVKLSRMRRDSEDRANTTMLDWSVAPLAQDDPETVERELLPEGTDTINIRWVADEVVADADWWPRKDDS